MTGTIPRLLVAWATVAAFQFAGGPLLALGGAGAALVFAWLLAVIFWSAFGVVHEAEDLAHRLGEPLGTLILTLSIVIIEVALISAVMLGAESHPTLGRDTMFAVLMIVLNGVVGLGLLIGGAMHEEQKFNLRGAASFLGVLIPLAVIALVLPTFTVSTERETLSTFQAVAFSILTVLLYAMFLWLQTGHHRGYFQSEEDALPEEHPMSEAVAEMAEPPVARHIGLLLANILPIVLLSKSLAKLLDAGIDALGLPVALGGILIAMIVFTPEGIAALRAATANQLTRAVNLCLGAATSTLGLTVPAVLLIGLWTGETVKLGLGPANLVLLTVTLFLASQTFARKRTTMLEGAVHLTLFAVFLVLVFSP